jgi:hypothetical protein
VTCSRPAHGPEAGETGNLPERGEVRYALTKREWQARTGGAVAAGE